MISIFNRMAEIYKRVKRPTDLLINLSIDPIGELHFKDVLWDAEFFTSKDGYRLHIAKNDAFIVDDDNYLCPVETGMLEAGILQCELHTRIVSDYFEDGYQDEIVIFKVDNIILD